MTAVVDLEECRSEVSSDKYPSRARVGKSNGGGGGMDDVLKRLGVLESSVADIRAQVSGISATIPHLATKADVSAVEAAIIKWIIATVLTTAGLVFTIAKLVH
jgi:hypothetical protein